MYAYALPVYALPVCLFQFFAPKFRLCHVTVPLKTYSVLQACWAQLDRRDFLMKHCSAETRLGLAACDWAADKSQVAYHPSLSLSSCFWRQGVIRPPCSSAGPHTVGCAKEHGSWIKLQAHGTL